MVSILSGLLGSLFGGPQNIIKTIGSAIGDIASGIKQKKPFLNILGDVVGGGLKRIIGINDEKMKMAEPQAVNDRITIMKDINGREPVKPLQPVGVDITGQVVPMPKIEQPRELIREDEKGFIRKEIRRLERLLGKVSINGNGNGNFRNRSFAREL